MKVVKISDLKSEEPVSAHFIGKVGVQTMQDDRSSDDPRIIVVNFTPGAHSEFHVHNFDQILYVTKGKGVISTDNGESVVLPGTIIFLRAGDRHQHAAAKDSEFSHLVINANRVQRQ